MSARQMLSSSSALHKLKAVNIDNAFLLERHSLWCTLHLHLLSTVRQLIIFVSRAAVVIT